MYDYKFRIRQRKRIFDYNLNRAIGFKDLSESSILSDHKADDPITPDELARDLALFSLVAAVGSLDELMKSLYCDALIGYLTGDYCPLDRIRASIPIAAARTLMDALARGDDIAVGLLPTLTQTAIMREYDRDNFQSASAISGALRSLGGPKLKVCLRDYGPGNVPAAEACSLFDRLAKSRHLVVHRLSVESRSLEADTEVSNAREPVSGDELEALKEIGNALVGYFTARAVHG
ncbi:hypothetical protein [Gordonia sp. YY1]|uniref:hypothetical protein n=1 Tax=Gordonia sp. YY1 TaxID=396712 RepID=UPI0013315339|nr:hypothetical protein [Gordonia sp. YY1]KAF0970611.1 hypothetical protein BPODLACK_00884 [Gordonia sp. YY1]